MKMLVLSCFAGCLPCGSIVAWSPEGTWVLFVSGEHYNCHPHIMRADGTGLKKLADRSTGCWSSKDNHEGITHAS